MVRVSTGCSELEVVVQGEGEPVLTIHGAFFGEALVPLSKEPVLADRYKVITYHRHGYGKSSKPEAPYTLDDVITDSLTVLQEVGEEKAHVVVHSAGATYGLALAMSHPDTVRSLTLMDPALPTPEFGEFLQQHFAPAGQALQEGDPPKALDLCFGPVYGGTHYRTEMDQHLPDGWLEDAVADLPNLFIFETSVLREFTFGPDHGKHVTQPVLVLEGSDTEPIFRTNNRYAMDWIPGAQHAVVPGANHMFPLLQPAETARALVSFLESHPISDASVSQA